MPSSRRVDGRVRKRLRCLALIIAFMAVPAALSLSAPPAPPQLLTDLFEPFPPKAVVRPPRRQPYQPAKPPTVVELKEEQLPTDWAALLEQLPKDANGGTDWVAALNDGLISLKPGIEPNAEDEPVLDLDVELEPRDVPEFKATYPHKIHTQMLACANCHTGIFQMERGADPITMEKIFAGEYCGRCHGKVAFDPTTGCPRCHREMPK